MPRRTPDTDAAIEIPIDLEPAVELIPRSPLESTASRVVRRDGEDHATFEFTLACIATGLENDPHAFARLAGYDVEFADRCGLPARVAGLTLAAVDAESTVCGLVRPEHRRRRVDHANSTMQKCAYLPPVINPTRIVRQTAALLGVDADEPSGAAAITYALLGSGDRVDQIASRIAPCPGPRSPGNWTNLRRAAGIPAYPNPDAPLWRQIFDLAQIVETLFMQREAQIEGEIEARQSAARKRRDAKARHPAQASDGTWRGPTNPQPETA